MSDKIETKVIQVTNISPIATKDQMKTLFSFLGRIDELKLYPSDPDLEATSKVCYVKYDDEECAGVALHLTSTVFIDRALIVVPITEGKIPEESVALQMAPSAMAGMIPGQSTWPSNVVSQVSGTGINMTITTYDPRLTALGLAQYPALPGNTDPTRIEEIRRTVYVGNLDLQVTAEQLLSFFSQVGEIKYVRMAGDDMQSTRFAFVEFSDQRSVATALSYSGVMFSGRPIKVNHSSTAINKPSASGSGSRVESKEMEEAMRKVNEAHSFIKRAVGGGRSKSRSPVRKRKTRSRSRSRRRSRTPSTRRRSRSKKRSRSRKRSTSRPKRRSRSRKRSGSRSRIRRSRSRGRRRRSRSGINQPVLSRRSRSPRPRSPRRRSRSKTRRSRSRTRRSRSKSRRTPPKSHNKKSKSRSPNRHKKSPPKSRRKSESKSPSPPKLEKEGSPKPEEDKKDSSGKATSDDKPAKKSSDKVIADEKPQAKRSSRSRSRSLKRSLRRSRSPGRKSSRRRRSRSRGRRSVSPRRRSVSPRRRSRSPKRRSPSPRRRSPSPRRRSRSRSGSRHRSSKARKDKHRDRERDRERDRSRERERNKRRHREKEREKDDKRKDVKVVRDYDEEEKGFASGEEEGKGEELPLLTKQGEAEPQPEELTTSDGCNLQQLDMELSD